MGNWIVNAVSGMGYVGIFFLMLIENIFPPIPSELVMPLGGYLSTQDKMNIWAVIVVGAIGSVAGQTLLYFLARKLGEEKVREWVGKHGRWVTISPQEVDKSTKWFHDHGGRAVLFGRMIPGVRSLISIPAGLGKMPLGKFLLCTALGATLWASVLAYAGYFLGNRFENVERFLSPATWIIVGVTLAIYLYRVVTYRPKEKAGTLSRATS
ncbi:DedA family protein [bacterium]|nr:MAG: DedA family protein [bacterium]